MEEELALNDADPSNAVSKKCKHGVKTLVDTIVDQPCQYGNVVIMSQGAYYVVILCGHYVIEEKNLHLP